MYRLLRQRSVQVILVIALYLSVAAALPEDIHRGLYTVSLCVKDLLLWLLPITVSVFIAHAVSSFEKQAPLFLLALFAFEAVSNMASVWYAFGWGMLTTGQLTPLESSHFVDAFSPLWRLPFAKPVWWTADKGTIAGIALGLLAAFKGAAIRSVISTGKSMIEKILTQGFARLIPLFVLGFVARMYKMQLLHQMVSQYADFLLWLVVCLVSYMLLLFLVGNGSLKGIKNLLPATGIAFSSGCSLSTMPWTIEGTAKNLDNPDLAKAVIPATTNIQQIGDCIANAFLCFVIYVQFNGYAPTLVIWMPFTLVFVLARFATAAVLGGAIFVMLPIYESYLRFTPEMIAIILAFNVILDPLITCSNVLANGALCRVFEKTWRHVLRQQSKPQFEDTL